ncbi:MAG: pilus assembly protein [Crocinitomicaceae bacterium]|jgi:type IV pilus assembly protein PilZ|nr:MAG: pilus assembly protein [Crocinitomicaceae bacterium]
MIPPGGGAMIQANFSDKVNLQACYMPYIAGGGIFIASKQQVVLGQELLVIASLPEHTAKFPITGKVIWISPKQNGIKPQGFAIQLAGEKGVVFRNEAERLLAGSLNAEKQTFTM